MRIGQETNPMAPGSEMLFDSFEEWVESCRLFHQGEDAESSMTLRVVQSAGGSHIRVAKGAPQWRAIVEEIMEETPCFAF